MASFLGTQEKCAACEKTVYVVDQLSVDGIAYHKSCFRCHHCHRTLQLSDYSSFDGVLYCKPHFEQLFKMTGSFDKSFDSAVKASPRSQANTPRTPSKYAFSFSGTLDKCICCDKKVYPLEKVSVEGMSYHKSCFKCVHGGCYLNPSTYAALEGRLYCRHHFSQLFKEKGDYSQIIKTPPVRAHLQYDFEANDKNIHIMCVQGYT